MLIFRYGLATSTIRIRAKTITTVDPYTSPSESTTVEDVQVELIHRAIDRSEEIRPEGRKHSTDVSVTLTPDGRLQTLDYKSTGIGSSVVTAAAKVLAFVATVAGAIGRAGGLAAQADKPAKDAGRAAWEEANPSEAQYLKSQSLLAAATSEQLTQVRKDLVKEADPVALKCLAAREQVLAGLQDVLREEIARVVHLFHAWLSGRRTITSTRVEYLLDVADLPTGSGDTAPQDVGLKDNVERVWRELGVLLQIVDAVGHAGATTTDDGTSVIRWRIPRPVEILVWKRTSDGTIALVSRTPDRIVDNRSETHSMELRASLFGEHGGTWSFNEDGSPASIKLQYESPVGAFATALGGVPAAIAEASTHAKNVADTWNAIHDGAAEREKADVERELAVARARLDLVGLNATKADFGALQRAEQAVKLRSAYRTLSPATEAVEDLKREVELTTAQAKLETTRRTAVLEANLASLAADVARVELEAKIAKAKAGE